MHQYTYRSHPPVDSKHIHNNAVDFEKTYWCHVTNITKAIYFFSMLKTPKVLYILNFGG